MENFLLPEKNLEYLASIVEGSEDAIIGSDLNGVVRSCNRGAERMYGYAAAEMVGQSVFMLLPEDRRTEVDPILDRIRAGGSVAAHNSVRVHKSGRIINVSVTISPIIDGTGHAVGASSVARDISGQLELQRQLERIASDNERLYREAREANQLKDQFLAMLSHELRTPLTSIAGWADILRRQQVEPDTFRMAIESIARNVALQTKLVDDLLDVSRIVNGKMRVHPELVDMENLTALGVANMKSAADAKNIVLTHKVEGRIGPVLCDPARMQQVIINLLSNAIKFTPADGKVELILRNEAGQTAIIVRDNGIGILAEFLPHVFDRFRQFDTSLTKNARGLGLGLSIVHHIVELHGGTVTAQSDGPGKGSSFRVLLPRTSDGAGVPEQ